MTNTGEQIIKELSDVVDILKSWDTAKPLLDDADYLKESLITRTIHILGHLEKLRRIGNI